MDTNASPREEMLFAKNKKIKESYYKMPHRYWFYGGEAFAFALSFRL